MTRCRLKIQLVPAESILVHALLTRKSHSVNHYVFLNMSRGKCSVDIPSRLIYTESDQKTKQKDSEKASRICLKRKGLKPIFEILGETSMVRTREMSPLHPPKKFEQKILTDFPKWQNSELYCDIN